MKRIIFLIVLLSLSTLAVSAFVAERLTGRLGSFAEEFRAVSKVAGEIYLDISSPSIEYIQRRKFRILSAIRDDLRAQFARANSAIIELSHPLETKYLSEEELESFLAAVPRNIRDSIEESGELDEEQIRYIFKINSEELSYNCTSFADMLEEGVNANDLAGQRAVVTINFGKMLVTLGAIEKMASEYDS